MRVKVSETTEDCRLEYAYRRAVELYAVKDDTSDEVRNLSTEVRDQRVILDRLIAALGLTVEKRPADVILYRKGGPEPVTELR